MKAYDLNYQKFKSKTTFYSSKPATKRLFLRSTNVGIFCKKKKKSLLIFALFLVFFNFLLAFSVVMKLRRTRGVHVFHIARH